MHFVWTLNSFQSSVLLSVFFLHVIFSKFLLCSGNNWEGDMQLKLKAATSHIKYVNSAVCIFKGSNFKFS